MATLNDVAAAAGVSVSAVSRVLASSPDARVSEATRERIFAAARELDYRPNFAARALKSARTLVIGLVMPDITNALFTDLVRGVDEEAASHGYRMLLARSEGLGRSETAIRALVGEGRVDAVILQIDDSSSAEETRRMAASGLPLVFVNSAPSTDQSTVVFDDEAAAELAAGHLIELGHKRIGFVGGLPTTDTAVRRRAGFERAMAQAGLALDSQTITELGYRPAQGAEALGAILAADARPTALLVANINAALGLLIEARERGLSIPEDLSVIAIHDAWTAEIVWRPLTTVRLPWLELGRASVRLAVERIEHGQVRSEVIATPAPELRIRETTAPPPTS